MAAVNVMAASRPNAPTARAMRKACRRCSNSSCTSNNNSSIRFSPTVNNRRATSFEVAANSVKPAVDSTITKLIAVAGASASSQITDQRPNTQGDGHGLVGMLMYGFVRRFGALDGFVADTPGQLLGPIQGGGE